MVIRYILSYSILLHYYMLLFFNNKHTQKTLNVGQKLFIEVLLYKKFSVDFFKLIQI
jgi:hypothetical protein